MIPYLSPEMLQAFLEYCRRPQTRLERTKNSRTSISSRPVIPRRSTAQSATRVTLHRLIRVFGGSQKTTGY